MLTLTEQEKARLQRLQQDVTTVESLKKLFLNSFMKTEENAGVEVLAAQRIAISLLNSGFKELDRLQKTERPQERETNTV